MKKEVVREEEGCSRGRRRLLKEDYSTRTTNELAEEGGQWRRNNKFVKKVVREEEGDLGRLSKKKATCEEEGDLCRRLFAKKATCAEEYSRRRRR